LALLGAPHRYLVKFGVERKPTTATAKANDRYKKTSFGNPPRFVLSIYINCQFKMNIIEDAVAKTNRSINFVKLKESDTLERKKTRLKGIDHNASFRLTCIVMVLTLEV
jgi:hypothetical protein